MSFNELKKQLRATGSDPFGLLIKSGDIIRLLLESYEQSTTETEVAKPVS